MKAIIFFFTLVALITSLQLVPKLTDSDIIWGQVGKQSVAAEMARSLLLNQREGVFPLRHFMEIYHDRPVPWAEEVPIYSLLNQTIARITSIDVVIIGRINSFASFLLLLLGFFRLGTVLQKDERILLFQNSRFTAFLSLNWIFVFLALCFPVFRIYSVSMMPDLPMAATLVWTWVFALQGRWKSAGFMGVLACAFKYYAAFSIVGIVLWSITCTPKYRDKFKAVFWGVCVIAPTLAYLFYFLLKGIPNPITEYPIWNGGGHVGMQMLLTPAWYSRLVTWLLVKNPGLPAGLLAFFGFSVLWNKRKDFKSTFVLFVATQFIAGLLFIILFSTSFYVHDYYGLQWALLEVVAAGFALHILIERSDSTNSKALVCALVVSIAGFGIVRTHSATAPQHYFLGFSEFLKTNTTPSGYGLVFTERPVESALFSASRTAWVVHYNRWTMPTNSSQLAEIQTKTDQLIDQRLLDPRLEWVALLTVDEKRDDLLEKIRNHLEKTGFQSMHATKNTQVERLRERHIDFQPRHSRDSAAHLVWIPRTK